MQAPRSLSSEQSATFQSVYTCLDTTRKRHTCPICEGTGRLTDMERLIALNVIELADWARDAQHQVEVAVAIQAITKLFLLGIGNRNRSSGDVDGRPIMTENEKIIPLPSLEYLLSCSQKGLQDVELASLNRAANCLKQAKIEWDEACAYREAAGVARWLRENREALLQVATRSLDVHINSDLLNLVTLSGPKTGLDALLGASEEQKKKDSH